MANYRIEGTERIQRKLEQLRKSVPQSVVIGLFRLGEKVMDATLKRVPTDTGELRDSAYVAAPQLTGQVGSVEVGFGAEHAPAVHEKTEVSHNTGEPKFLEKAIMEEARGSLHIVAREAEKHAERGGTPSGKYPTRPKT